MPSRFKCLSLKTPNLQTFILWGLKVKGVGLIAEGFRVLNLEGLGLRNRCLNLKLLRFKLYGLRFKCLNLKP